MLGEKLKSLRKENKISQEELAERLDVSRQSISLWENDQTLPSMEKIVALANIFGVTTDYLLMDSVCLSENETENKKTSKKLRVWEILLLVLGSPIWVSLAAAVIVIALSLYVSLWAVIISLWAVFVSLIGGFVCGAVSCVIFAFGGNGASGVAMLSAGLVCAGLAIFAFYGCNAATKGTLWLTRKTVIWIKNLFIAKEAAK
ncbi:MAG: helix-turn-helix domain-containing protein [Clostridia bacterium]|nr:helix-turn-helix domain-containing protein [Clostridia bacterium]